VFVVFCVGSELCDTLITGSEEFYQLCVFVCVCVCVYDLETSTVRLPKLYLLFCATEKERLH